MASSCARTLPKKDVAKKPSEVISANSLEAAVCGHRLIWTVTAPLDPRWGSIAGYSGEISNLH
jgi:hypothetical protein